MDGGAAQHDQGGCSAGPGFLSVLQVESAGARRGSQTRTVVRRPAQAVPEAQSQTQCHSLLNSDSLLSFHFLRVVYRRIRHAMD